MSDLQQQPTLLLTLKSVEVSQRLNEATFPVTSGPLSVFYYLQNNTFVLQTNNFSYTLSKDATIFASPPHHGQLYPSYIFPANSSEFILRITDSISPEALSSFESLLSNQSNLSYKEEPEPEISLVGEADSLENEPLIQLKEEAKKPPVQVRVQKNCITKSGDLARSGIIWTGGLVSKGIAKLGGFVESKCTKATEEKEVKPAIAQKLAVADSATETAFTFTQLQMKKLLGLGKCVEQKILDSELNHKFEQSKYHDSVTRIGMSSLYAAACVYDGLVNGIILIGKGIRDTTVHGVSNSYGEKVGDATKHGFNAVGNIGKIAMVYHEEVREFIDSQNGNQQKPGVQLTTAHHMKSD